MKFTYLAGTSLLLAAATACSDRAIGTEPSIRATLSAASFDKGGATDRTVNILDACDGPSFAAQNPPVLCTRNGGVTFDQLIAQLTANQSAGAWHFAPSQMDAKVGLTLFAVNKGGEVHTFTHVAHFGGGIVPPLNALSNNPVPAAECLALLTPGHDDDFIPPGGTYDEDVVGSGTSLYQCCIHPWMRTVVNGKG